MTTLLFLCAVAAAFAVPYVLLRATPFWFRLTVSLVAAVWAFVAVMGTAVT